MTMLMFGFHLRCRVVVVVPKNRKDFTVLTEKSVEVMGLGVAAIFPKSTTSSTVFRALSPK